MSGPKFMARCTSCKQAAAMTAEQLQEAREIGCAFSDCCGAVATVESVTVRLAQSKRSSAQSRRDAKRRAEDAKYLQPGWSLPEVRS